jgi:CRISPR/Cas system-associated exonuclease Cas4 (RecB family)
MIEDILNHTATFGTPPPADSVEDVLLRVKEYLLYLNSKGGKIIIQSELVYHSSDGPEPVLRPSSAGKCPRALAYKKLYPDEGEPLTSRSISVFALGHVIHDMERQLISTVCPLHDVEKQVEFDLDGHKIVGHIDGLLQLTNSLVLLDIKTTNASSYERMLREGPSPDYVAQLNVYLAATGLKEGYLWLFNKDTAHRAILPVRYDYRIVEEVKKRWLSVLHATVDNMPDRAYSPISEVRKGKQTGREYLPWQCSYCAFVRKCWEPEGFQLFIEDNKPRWIREQS